MICNNTYLADILRVYLGAAFSKSLSIYRCSQNSIFKKYKIEHVKEVHVYGVLAYITAPV